MITSENITCNLSKNTTDPPNRNGKYLGLQWITVKFSDKKNVYSKTCL